MTKITPRPVEPKPGRPVDAKRLDELARDHVIWLLGACAALEEPDPQLLPLRPAAASNRNGAA